MDNHTSETPLKTCTKCGIDKPATAEYFNRNGKTKDGLRFWCRDCLSLYKGLVPITIREKQPDMRSCRQCGIIYPFNETFFHVASGNHFGLMHICKPCACNKSKEYAQKDPVMTRIRKKNEYLRNKKRYQITCHNWYIANRNAMILNSVKWKQSNPEKYRLHMRTGQARRLARKRNNEYAFTSQDWERALNYFDNKCAVCKSPVGLFKKLAMDHWVALSKGGGTTPKNIVPLCDGFGGCNESKHNRDALEWLTERYGKRKASSIFRRVQDYFNQL